MEGNGGSEESCGLRRIETPEQDVNIYFRLKFAQCAKNNHIMLV